MFVAPEPIEAVLRASPLVGQVLVWGSAAMRNVGAVVVPRPVLLRRILDHASAASGRASDSGDATAASDLASIGGDGGDTAAGASSVALAPTPTVEAAPTLADLCGGPGTAWGRIAAEFVLRDLRALSASGGLRGAEVPCGVVLDMEPWTGANGYLTATGKAIRPKLIARYRPRLVAELQRGGGGGSGDCEGGGNGGDGDRGGGNGSGGSGVAERPGVLAAGSVCAGLLQALRESGALLNGLGGGVGAAASSGDLASLSLVALGLDSLGMARLSSKLAKAFGVKLSPRALYLIPTLGDLEAVRIPAKSTPQMVEPSITYVYSLCVGGKCSF